MRKQQYTKNSVVEKGSSPSKTSPSQDEENRRQVSEFLGRFLHSWSSLYDNFREPPRKLGTLGKSWDQNKCRQTSGHMVKYPRTRAEIPNDIGQDRQASSRGNDLNYFWPLRNPLQKRLRRWERRGTSITERIPQENLHIGNGWESSASKHPRCGIPCKTKEPNWSYIQPW